MKTIWFVEQAPSEDSLSIGTVYPTAFFRTKDEALRFIADLDERYTLTAGPYALNTDTLAVN